MDSLTREEIPPWDPEASMASIGGPGVRRTSGMPHDDSCTSRWYPLLKKPGHLQSWGWLRYKRLIPIFWPRKNQNRGGHSLGWSPDPVEDRMGVSDEGSLFLLSSWITKQQQQSRVYLVRRLCCRSISGLVTLVEVVDRGLEDVERGEPLGYS